MSFCWSLYLKYIEQSASVSLYIIYCTYCFSVNYASGCSIAKFPEEGIVIAQTFKDQGTQLHIFIEISK